MNVIKFDVLQVQNMQIRVQQRTVSLFLDERRKGVPPFKKLDLQPFEDLKMLHSQIYGVPQKNIQQQAKNQTISDGRKYILNSKPIQKQSNHKYPYSAVGNICVKKYYNKRLENSVGTGFLIGPNLVLTCAHNIVGCNQQDIEFFPTLFKQKNKKGFKVRRVYLPEIYKKLDTKKPFNEQPAHSYDFAVIELQTKVSLNGKTQQINLQAYFGSLGYDFSWQAYAQYLYPNSQVQDLQLWCIPIRQNGPSTSRSKGNSAIYKNHLVYAMETEQGVSGTPVVCKENDDYYVIGIHVKKWQNHYRAALKLTLEMFKMLQDGFTRRQYNYIYNANYNVKQLEQYIENVKADPRRFSYISVNFSKVLALGPILCKALERFQVENLVALNLSSNKIGDKGCQLLRGIKWKNLQRLKLQWNQITCMGCIYLAQSQWQKLQILDLSCNSIKKSGVYQLACIKIKEDGVERFNRLIFPSLQKLILHGIEIDRRQIQIMQRETKWFILV